MTWTEKNHLTCTMKQRSASFPIKCHILNVLRKGMCDATFKNTCWITILMCCIGSVCVCFSLKHYYMEIMHLFDYQFKSFKVSEVSGNRFQVLTFFFFSQSRFSCFTHRVRPSLYRFIYLFTFLLSPTSHLIHNNAPRLLYDIRPRGNVTATH